MKCDKSAFIRSKNIYIFVFAFIPMLIWPILRYWSVFSQPINIQDYAEKYSRSQYVLGEASPQKISDSELYVYAGYAYSLGEDPTTVNFEHPPLAKYGYGLFYQLFGNPYLLNIPLYFGVFYLFYLIAGLVVKKWYLRLAGVITLGSLSLFQAHFRYALLDLPLLFGYLLFLYGMLSDFKTIKRGLLLGLGFGVVLTVKYPFPMVGLLLGILLIDSYIQKKWKSSLMALVIGAAVYFLSYWQFFAHGNSLLDWLAFEKYRLNWFMGKTDAPKFLIFQTLFTGRFKAWWDAELYAVMDNWSLIWPVLFVGSTFSFFKAIIKKHYQLLVLLTFSYAQLIIYGIGSAASDRFFITLLPFWIMGLLYLVENLQFNLKNLGFKND